MNPKMSYIPSSTVSEIPLCHCRGPVLQLAAIFILLCKPAGADGWVGPAYDPLHRILIHMGSHVNMQQLRKGHPSLLYVKQTKNDVFFFVTSWPVQERVLESFGYTLHWAWGPV